MCMCTRAVRGPGVGGTIRSIIMVMIANVCLRCAAAQEHHCAAALNLLLVHFQASLSQFATVARCSLLTSIMVPVMTTLNLLLALQVIFGGKCT